MANRDNHDKAILKALQDIARELRIMNKKSEGNYEDGYNQGKLDTVKTMTDISNIPPDKADEYAKMLLDNMEKFCNKYSHEYNIGDGKVEWRP